MPPNAKLLLGKARSHRSELSGTAEAEFNWPDAL